MYGNPQNPSGFSTFGGSQQQQQQQQQQQPGFGRPTGFGLSTSQTHQNQPAGGFGRPTGFGLSTSQTHQNQQPGGFGNNTGFNAYGAGANNASGLGTTQGSGFGNNVGSSSGTAFPPASGGFQRGGTGFNPTPSGFTGSAGSTSGFGNASQSMGMGQQSNSSGFAPSFGNPPASTASGFSSTGTGSGFPSTNQQNSTGFTNTSSSGFPSGMSNSLMLKPAVGFPAMNALRTPAGNSTNATGFGNFGAAGNTTTGFGQSTPGQGFGNNQGSTQGFGNTAGGNQGFGNSTGASQGFTNTPGTAFGQAQGQQQQPATTGIGLHSQPSQAQSQSTLSAFGRPSVPALSTSSGFGVAAGSQSGASGPSGFNTFGVTSTPKPPTQGSALSNGNVSQPGPPPGEAFKSLPRSGTLNQGESAFGAGTTSSTPGPAGNAASAFGRTTSATAQTSALSGATSAPGASAFGGGGSASGQTSAFGGGASTAAQTSSLGVTASTAGKTSAFGSGSSAASPKPAAGSGTPTTVQPSALASIPSTAGPSSGLGSKSSTEQTSAFGITKPVANSSAAFGAGSSNQAQSSAFKSATQGTSTSETPTTSNTTGTTSAFKASARPTGFGLSSKTQAEQPQATSAFGKVSATSAPGSNSPSQTKTTELPSSSASSNPFASLLGLKGSKTSSANQGYAADVAGSSRGTMASGTTNTTSASGFVPKPPTTAASPFSSFQSPKVSSTTQATSSGAATSLFSSGMSSGSALTTKPLFSSGATGSPVVSQPVAGIGSAVSTSKTEGRDDNQPAWQHVQNLRARIDPLSPRCELVHVFYNVVHPDKVDRYQKPDGVADSVWEMAMRNNPDPTCRVPVLAVGFEALQKRKAFQERTRAAYLRRIKQIRFKVNDMQETYEIALTVRLHSAKLRQLQIQARVFSLMSSIFHMRLSRGAMMSPGEEEALKVLDQEAGKAIETAQPLLGLVRNLREKGKDGQSKPKSTVTWDLVNPAGVEQLRKTLVGYEKALDSLLKMAHDDIKTVNWIQRDIAAIIRKSSFPQPGLGGSTARPDVQHPPGFSRNGFWT